MGMVETYNVVVGAGGQWGDEGKGALVDRWLKDADMMVRFQGGPNAGHTLVVDGKQTILHIVPSGALHPDKLCVIGNGVVIDPKILFGEIAALRAAGHLLNDSQLAISLRAHLIMPYHKAIEAAREALLGDGKIGTTLRGIGPCMEDAASRLGIRVCDLLNEDVFRRKLEASLREKNLFLQALGSPTFSVDDIMAEFAEFREKFKPFVTDVAALLRQAIKDGKKILLEGAQGVMLDREHGTYPYVTSSSTVAGNAACGSGIGPTDIGFVANIVKAYTTRVGGGPFPTELLEGDEIGDHIQEKGAEFGATTKRRRRCGWLDMVVVDHGISVNGAGGLAITKLDVLDELAEILICVGYRFKGTGPLITTMPADLDYLAQCEPVYETCAGWQTDTSKARSLDDLPPNARKYLSRIAELAGLPIIAVSVGAEREAMIEVVKIF